MAVTTNNKSADNKVAAQALEFTSLVPALSPTLFAS
jgi:hypothetical protein